MMFQDTHFKVTEEEKAFENYFCIFFWLIVVFLSVFLFAMFISFHFTWSYPCLVENDVFTSMFLLLSRSALVNMMDFGLYWDVLCLPRCRVLRCVRWFSKYFFNCLFKFLIFSSLLAHDSFFQWKRFYWNIEGRHKPLGKRNRSIGFFVFIHSSVTMFFQDEVRV